MHYFWFDVYFKKNIVNACIVKSLISWVIRYLIFFAGNLPPPTTPEEVGARVLAQERHGKRGVSAFYDVSCIFINTCIVPTNTSLHKILHSLL